ncbi:MAG: TIGR01777 family protein [Saprospiraceae bacterium]|nr:TIGR01777 family protein [Saprospiraceae bacterium]
MAIFLIAGGSGMIGKSLSQKLNASDHEVRILSRKGISDVAAGTFQWDPAKDWVDEKAFEGVDYVINLAGAGIASKRWSSSRKKVIIDSRVRSTLLLKKYLQKEKKVRAYLGASAIGFYGNRPGELLSEESLPGKGFLSETCQLWESAHNQIAGLGIRTVILRIGIVLDADGGAFPKMVMPFKLGLGNTFGSGKQIYSWIHVQDVCGLFQMLALNENAKGIYNLVSPNPKTQKAFAESIRKNLFPKSLIVPVPEIALQVGLGEMKNTVMDSAEVSAGKVLGLGYSFIFPELAGALVNL